MIFNELLPTDIRFSRLKACYRRASIFGRAIPKPPHYDDHPLGIQWENCLLTLYYPFDNAESIAENLYLLDWFASRVENFSQENLLKGDDVVAYVLHHWLRFLPINPLPLK